MLSAVHPQVSLPKPMPGVTVCMTVVGMQAASASRQNTSSRPKLCCIIATDVRTMTANSAIAPAAIEVLKRMTERSRGAIPHIVCVVLTATVTRSQSERPRHEL